MGKRDSKSVRERGSRIEHNQYGGLEKTEKGKTGIEGKCTLRQNRKRKITHAPGNERKGDITLSHLKENVKERYQRDR